MNQDGHGGLSSLAKDCARGNELFCKLWMEEFHRYYIFHLDDLVQRAGSVEKFKELVQFTMMKFNFDLLKEFWYNNLFSMDALFQRSGCEEDFQDLVQFIGGNNFLHLKELWHNQIFSKSDLQERSKNDKIWKSTLSRLSESLRVKLEGWCTLEGKNKKIEFSWKEPKHFLFSEGSKWEYQSDPNVHALLRYEITNHYSYWKEGIKDKHTHPLFLCLSGPGTGKSRLLNEFPRLVKESVSEVIELEPFIKDHSYCFNVSFEFGTEEDNDPFDPSSAIGTRMMYQLQDQLSWADFRKKSPYSIPEAIRSFSKIIRQESSNICIILCIDGMHKLKHKRKNKNSSFYNTISAICSVVNDNDAFVVAICSATLYHAVTDVLEASSQRRIFLIPPLINPGPIFDKKDELTSLLASDMGGHGRALEMLYVTLSNSPIQEFGYTNVLLEVVFRIRMAYPDIIKYINELESILLHVIARKSASSLGKKSLDRILSLGLFRLNERKDLLEFPYVLWLICKSKALPWENYHSWAPKEDQDVFRTWEEWEDFNCKYRIIKSKAFEGKSVNWKEIHSGARFGPNCDEIIHERALRFQKCSKQMNTASIPVGVWHEKDSCKHDDKIVGKCIQVGHHSSSGDSFVCLHSVNSGSIHEVHQDKCIKSEIKYDQFIAEREKSASKNDLFILFCTGKVDEKVLTIHRSAFVDSSCWKQYYGPFAARAYFMKTKIPPKINLDDAEILRFVPGVGKAFAAAIIKERSRGNFIDASDAEKRLRKVQGLKNVQSCVKLFRYD